MQNIFDSHAHYDDPRFDEDRDALLGSMAEHGVRAIMNVGNTTHANLAGIELAKQYPFIYCSIGIHPDQAAEIAAQNSREYLDVIARQLSYEKAALSPPIKFLSASTEYISKLAEGSSNT